MGCKMNNTKEKLYDLDALNGLRVIAAFMVVLFHYNKLTGGSHVDVNFPFYSVLKIAYVNGGLMVEMFFLISGLCLYRFYSERLIKREITVIDFLKKRFLKLYPLYILTTIITVGLQQVYFKVNGIYFENNFDGSWRYLLLNLLGIARGWYENNTYPYNAPAWYVSVLLFVYIVFSMICYISSRGGRMKTKLIVLTMLGMSVGIFLRWKEMQYAIFNVEIGRGLQSFFLGGLIYLVIEKISSIKAKRQMIWCATVFFLIDTIFIAIRRENVFENFSYLPLFLFPKAKRQMIWCATVFFLIDTIFIAIRRENVFENFSYLPLFLFPYIVIISIFNRYVRKILTVKIFKKLNGITYEIFLLQYPVFILFKLIGDGMGINYYSLVVWILFWTGLLSVCYGFFIWKKRTNML